MTGLYYQLIRLKFNPNYVMQKKAILFLTKLSGMLKAEYIIYLWTYINTFSYICRNNTANYLKVGQQLLGLTLRITTEDYHLGLTLRINTEDESFDTGAHRDNTWNRSVYIYKVSHRSSVNGHKMCVGMYMYDGFIVYDFYV